MARPARLAVKVTAILKPPEMIGINVASVSKPNSGNWKAIEVKAPADRKLSAVAPNARMTTIRKTSKPATSP